MKSLTQKELLELIKNNPLGIDVFWNELSLENNEDVIFLDRISDRLILFDNTSIKFHKVQITCYIKNFDDLNIIVSYIDSLNFLTSFIFYKNNDYNVAAAEIEIFMKDWLYYED